MAAQVNEFTRSPVVSCCRFAEFDIDVTGRVLRREGKVLPLRRKSWQLLCLLAANPHHLLSKEELMAALWPGSIVVQDSLVQCVLELRRAIGDVDHRLLRTVPRSGYLFDVDVETEQASICSRAGHDPMHGESLLAWRTLADAQGASEVEIARALFETMAGEPELRADAMAGLAMSYVIEVLNRWALRPAWHVVLARQAADASISLDPGSARACHARAHVAMIEGRPVEAFLGFQAALARSPSMSRARLRLGVIEMELGHPERTFEHVRLALRTCGGEESVQAQAYFIEGMASFHMGRDCEASDCFHRVLRLKPASGLAHQWLAATDALSDKQISSESHLAAFHRHVPGHTIESLRATERSCQPTFVRPRDRFYEGLRRAGQN